jgi:hypothetical protein
MALSARITLTSTGIDTGPFNLYSDVDNYITAFESSILKSNLISGFTTNNIPNNTSIVRLKSIGVCTNYIDFSLITLTPTPTPTSTGPTPTPTPTSTGPTPTPTATLSGELTILNQFQTGISNDSSYQLDPFTQAYQPTGEIWTTFKLDYNDTTGRVTVTTNFNGWAVNNADDIRYKVEISDKWLTKAELEAIDFSNQKGNDILIYAAKFESGVPRAGSTYLHVKGDSNTRLPGFVVRNPTKRMPQFVYNFPDIVVSPSKTNILEFHQLNTDFSIVSNNYTNKGFSISHGPANNQKFIGDYDQWAYSNGAPGPHNQPGALQWLRDRSIQQLSGYFQSLIGGAANVGFYFMDFEAFGYGAVDDQDIVNKLGTLFRRFNQANPNTIFTSYINANPVTSTYNKNLSSADRDLQNAKYTKTLSQIATGFFSRTVQYLNVENGNFTGESGNMGQYIAPVVGNYMTSIGFSHLYSTIQEFELAKKLLPANKVLSLNWGLNETLAPGYGSDYTIHEKAFKKNNGSFYKKLAKPPTPPSYMWNITLWSNIIGDGTWFWDEPLPFIEGYEYYGTSAQDMNGNALPNEFSPGLGSIHYHAQIGYDYVARALHFLSYNNDILEANTPVEKPEFSTNGGSTYYSGSNLLPASAEFSKLPLVRIKKHATLNQWIIIAVNHHLDHYTNQTIKVKINNKTIDIVLKGQYTTAERIAL